MRQLVINRIDALKEQVPKEFRSSSLEILKRIPDESLTDEQLLDLFELWIQLKKVIRT